MTCIDLRQFGDRFRVWNEAHTRRAHERDDIWDLVIPGAGGFVAPYGGEYLLACTNSLLTTRRILAAVPGAVVTRDGSDGQNVRFDVAHLDAAAEILRLRKRRRVDEAERRRLAELSRRHSPYLRKVFTGAIGISASRTISPRDSPEAD
jgi:hypothetical protein